MPQVFWPARPSGNVEQIVTFVADSSQPIVVGSLVVVAADGELEVCPADPVALGVVGVALQANQSNPGYQAANSPTVITGRQNTISVALANTGTIFMCQGQSGAGGNPITPTQTMVGEAYGVRLDSGTWTVDLDETTAKVVMITDIDVGAKLLFVKFLPAVQQVG